MKSNFLDLPVIKQIIAAINIVIISIICLDIYVLPPTIEKQQFDYTDRETIHSRGGGYETEEIVTTLGKRIQIPEEIYVPLNSGNNLIIKKTALLKRNLFVEFSTKDSEYKIPVGLLNDNRLYYKILYPLCFLFKRPLLKISDNWLYTLTLFNWLVSFSFYFIYY